MSSIEKFKNISMNITKITSFHLKSAYDNVINVGLPNCFTIAKSSCRNFFQYADVLLMVFMLQTD